ncbi:MAG: hypothetical protein JNM36_17150 [Chitinophagales bacterium]|jgi:hypothetical protein|nr:hypothetical protein [Chitinophagales bacterium]
MKKIPILSILLFYCVLSCTQQNNKLKFDNKNLPNTTILTTNPKHQNMTNYFPFKINDNDENFAIIVEIESAELYPKYVDFFEKYGYSGNGYCWEGHITQILEKLNPDLLQHIEFDPEAGTFFAYIDTKENQIKIVELLSPIFADLTKLEGYIKKADPSRIDD